MVKFRKMAAICAWIVCTAFLLSCAEFPFIGEVDDYPEYIMLMKQYEKEIPLYEPPAVTGFSPLVNMAFDFGKPFLGEYTQVAYDGYQLLLSKDGKLFYSPEHTIGKDLYRDRYIYDDSGLLGVRSIFGNVVVPAKYREIEFLGAHILALNQNGSVDLYRDDTLRKEGITDSVSLFAEGIFLYQDKLCDDTLTPLTAFGYDVVRERIHGAQIITDGLLFGYDFGQSFITPKYREIGLFNAYGYACIVDTADAYHIINQSGDCVFSEFDGMKPVGYNGETLVLWDGESFRLAGHEIEFYNLWSFTAVNGYLAEQSDDGLLRFYSIAKGEFLPQRYSSIKEINEYYVVQTPDGLFELLNKDLQRIVGDATAIAYDGNFLTVEKNQKFYFYKRIS